MVGATSPSRPCSASASDVESFDAWPALSSGHEPPTITRRTTGSGSPGPRLAVVSVFSVFAILLIAGVAAFGVAALIALILLLVRGRPAPTGDVES